MLTTPAEVLALAATEVTVEDIAIAQAIIESYIGRVESDLTDATDKAMVARAVVYQTAYMDDQSVDVFSQIAVRSQTSPDTAVVLDGTMDSPFIAPLAVLALRHLSWFRSRSVKTGPVYSKPVYLPWEVA